MRIIKLWITSFGCLALLSACVGQQPPTSPDAPARSTDPRLPARPAELRLDEVAACALLSDAQRTSRGLNAGEFKYEDVSTHYPLCQWDDFPAIPTNRYLARLQLHDGADAALDSSPDVQVIQVSGFSAVQTAADGPDPNRNCILVIDVAQGQSLWAQYNVQGSADGQTHQRACDLARGAAEDMVGNLRALVH